MLPMLQLKKPPAVALLKTFQISNQNFLKGGGGVVKTCKQSAKI